MVRGGGSRRKPNAATGPPEAGDGAGMAITDASGCRSTTTWLAAEPARPTARCSGTPPPWRHPGYLEALAGRFMLVLVDGRGRSGKPHDPPCTPPSAGRRRSLLPEVFDAVQELIRPDLELDCRSCSLTCRARRPPRRGTGTPRRPTAGASSASSPPPLRTPGGISNGKVFPGAQPVDIAVQGGVGVDGRIEREAGLPQARHRRQTGPRRLSKHPRRDRTVSDQERDGCNAGVLWNVHTSCRMAYDPATNGPPSPLKATASVGGTSLNLLAPRPGKGKGGDMSAEVVSTREGPIRTARPDTSSATKSPVPGRWVASHGRCKRLRTQAPAGYYAAVTVSATTSSLPL